MNRIPPSPPIPTGQRGMKWGDNALTAPITPGRRLPEVDKSKVDPATLKAAEGMEAMFLDYMMKTMRDTVPKSEMSLENSGTKIYQSMLDSEIAQQAARAGGVGLADQIIAYLEMGRYNSIEGPRVPPQNHGGYAAMSRSPETSNDQRSTGGTDEGQPIRE